MSKSPAIWRVYQNLAYEVVLTCPPGESWPRLRTETCLYEVIQVEVRVAVYVGEDHEPVLDPGQPRVLSARQVRKDGTLGRAIGTGRQVAYAGIGTGTDGVNAQAEKLEAQARKAALAAYRQFITAESERLAARPPAR